MSDASYRDILVAKGFTRIGQIDFRFTIELWWQPQRHIQLLTVPLGDVVMVKGDATYYLQARQGDDATWLRDIEAFHNYLESHFRELRLSFSFFRDLPEHLAGREARRLMDGTEDQSTAPTADTIATLQRQLETLQQQNGSLSQMLQLSGARNDLLSQHVQRQARQPDAPARKLADELRSQRQRFEVLNQLQREFERKGSAAVLTFSIHSNLHIAGVSAPVAVTGDEDAATVMDFAGVVDAVVGELSDYDRYHIRQKLNGGRLKVQVARSTEPALSWIELWGGGTLSPRQLAAIAERIPAAATLAEAAANHTVVTADEAITIDGCVRQHSQHLAAHVVRSALSRVDASKADSAPLDGSEAGLLLNLGLTADGQKAIVPLKSLGHIMISGTTGSGKTILARVVAEEIAQHASINLLVIDPRGQFTGCLLPEDRPAMLQHYERFGMKAADARRIDAQYLAPGSGLTPPLPKNLTTLTKGRWIACLKHLDDQQRCETAADLLNAAFEQYVTRESDRPRMVILIDEAQVLTVKRVSREATGAAGRCEQALDRIAREGRKHGIALCLVSQTMKSFGYGLAVLRQMAATKVFFRNSDLELDYAADLLPDPRALVQLPTGSALLHNAALGVVPIRVRPPKSFTGEVPESRLKSLLQSSTARAAKPLCPDASDLLQVITRHYTTAGGPLNLSDLAQLAQMSSRRKLHALVDVLEQSGRIRTMRLPERGKPRVIAMLS